MKLPLQYQISEYDCGPTSLRNAMAFLMEREKMPQEVLCAIMNICLDGYHAHGTREPVSVHGTSDDAMMTFAGKFNDIAKKDHLPYHVDVVLDTDVNTHNALIRNALHNGGAVVAKVMVDVAHYVLMTGEKDDTVRLFDPYIPEKPYHHEGVTWTYDHPHSYNVEVKADYMDRNDTEWWSFGKMDERIALVFSCDA
ncbi:MAG: hypothetical protein PUE16_07165 [Lactimicrobium massiliense]|nr:hypothetical protein [Lactimicrobium massiliense]MDD6727095.1 hypothetical protein [Lactimicrobium massiliense]